MRFTTITALVDCVHCGSPVPVLGPSSQLSCNSCLEATPVSSEEWGSFFESAATGATRTPGRLAFAFTHLTSHSCPRCGSALPLEQLEQAQVDSQRYLTCPSCQQTVSCQPAQPWVREAVPGVLQLLGCPVLTDLEQGSQVLAQSAAAKPVLMSCPGCGSSLKIASDTSRTHECEYCHNSIYLPDDLWLRLHPVRKAVPWTFAYEAEGPLKSTATLQRERQAETDRKRELQEKIERGIEEGKLFRMEVQNDRKKHVKEMLQVLGFVFGVFAIVAWLCSTGVIECVFR